MSQLSLGKLELTPTLSQSEPVKVAGVYGPAKPASQQSNNLNKQASSQQLAQKRLPQTGDDQNEGAVILGVVGMLSTIGLAALRRKRRN